MLTLFGTVAPGPYLSDLIQFFLGGVLVVSCFRAARVSDGLPRHFWQLAALAFSIWLVAQGIATYSDLLPVSEFSLWAENLLFCFWFVPLAMALFLDPDRERKGFDWLLVLDFVYLAPETSGIGFMIVLTGIPVYLTWSRLMASRPVI